MSHRAFRRFGFAQHEVVAKWPEIVGPALARCSLPERLTTVQDETKGGTLYIRVQGSMAPELQHFEPLVIERINSFYGYKAVERLSFRHGPVPLSLKKQDRPNVVLSDSQERLLQDQLQQIKDEKLKNSLYKLGKEIFGQEKQEKPKKKPRFSRRGLGSHTVKPEK